MSDLALYQALTEFIKIQTRQIRKIMGKLQDSLVALTAQVDKIFVEVSSVKTELAAVEQQLAELGVDTGVLDALKASVQRVDDLNPDEAP